MAKFKVIIDTRKYKPYKDEVANSIMYAMNGWQTTEHSYREVMWRLRSFAGYGIQGLYEGELKGELVNKHSKWWNKKDNRIVVDKDVWYDVRLPVIAMGYVDLNKKIEELKKNGNTTLDFADLFDIRQGRRTHFKGCYMLITRIN